MRMRSEGKGFSSCFVLFCLQGAGQRRDGTASEEGFFPVPVRIPAGDRWLTQTA